MSQSAATAICAVCLCALLGPPLRAESIVIDGERPRESITIKADEVSIGLVLDDLRARYGFEIGGDDNIRQSSDPISVSLSGSLYSILERLLRNRNHVIVRSPDNVSGIEKVIILDTAQGAGQPKSGAGGQAGNASGKVLQAASSIRSSAPPASAYDRPNE